MLLQKTSHLMPGGQLLTDALSKPGGKNEDILRARTQAKTQNGIGDETTYGMCRSAYVGGRGIRRRERLVMQRCAMCRRQKFAGNDRTRKVRDIEGQMPGSESQKTTGIV